MEPKIVNAWKPLTFLAKSFTLDNRMDSDYASEDIRNFFEIFEISQMAEVCIFYYLSKSFIDCSRVFIFKFYGASVFFPAEPRVCMSYCRSKKKQRQCDMRLWILT